MKKLIYNYIVILICLYGVVMTTGCEKDKESTAVELEAFGPCPVLRGNEITFIGKNLDKVTSIVIPGCPEIEQITKVSPELIKVTVPQEATEGTLVLNHPLGSITTKSAISFSEEYLISEMSPLTDLRAGDEITIEGDYLWSMVSVVFMSDAVVESEQFKHQDRNSIVVEIPREAKSGKIKVVDAAGNELYSDQELTIDQPVISSLSPLTIKAKEILTITGTDLDLVESITFPGDTTVNYEDFITQNSEQITVKVPGICQDGSITSTAFSAEQYESQDELDMVVPSSIGITALTRFKAGKEIKITGNDLDLVTDIDFSEEVNVDEFEFENGEIIVVIPATAVDGVLTLNTASTKSVETPSIELVLPVISAFNPIEITAGEEFTITGTDLDLVASVNIGSASCTIDSQSETSITVTTPLTASTGTIEVTLENEVSVESDDEITINPSTKPTVTSMPESAKPGESITLEGTNLNNVKGILFDDVEVSQYSERSATKLVFTVPENAPLGQYAILFKLYEGDDVETEPITIMTELTIFETETDLNDWSGSFRLYKEQFTDAGFEAGMTLRIYATVYGDWPQIQFNDADWGFMSIIQGGDIGEEYTDVVFTQDMIDTMMTVADTWSTTALVINGAGVIINKVTIVL